MVGNGKGLVKISESFLVAQESHEPEVEIIVGNYFNVLLLWFVDILALVRCFDLPYWYLNFVMRSEELQLSSSSRSRSRRRRRESDGSFAAKSKLLGRNEKKARNGTGGCR